jgi:hypothetical protein
MLQAFVQNVSSISGRMLQQMFYLDVAYFHTHVASVLSRCCIYFTHMLQVFYLHVAYVSHMFNSIFHMFYLCQTYVASKMFHVESVLWGNGE